MNYVLTRRCGLLECLAQSRLKVDGEVLNTHSTGLCTPQTLVLARPTTAARPTQADLAVDIEWAPPARPFAAWDAMGAITLAIPAGFMLRDCECKVMSTFGKVAERGLGQASLGVQNGGGATSGEYSE